MNKSAFSIVRCCVFLTFFTFSNCQIFAQSATPDKIPDLEKQLAAETDDSKKAFFCNELAFAYNQKDRKKALEMIAQARDFAKKSGNREEEVRAGNTEANIFLQTGKMDDAEKSAREALQLAKEIGFKKGEANSTNILGTFYTKKSENEKALQFYKEALKMREELGDLEGIGATLHNLGNLMSDQRKMLEARNFYQKAIEAKEKLPNKNSLGNSLLTLGNTYMIIADDLPKAESLYLRGQAIFEETQNLNGQNMVLTNLGNLYFQQNDYRKAIEIFQKALPIAEKQNSKPQLVSIFGMLSSCFHDLGDTETATKFGLKSETIALQIGDKQALTRHYQNRGARLTMGYNWDAAEKEYDKSIALAREINDNLSLGIALTGKGACLNGKKQHADALNFFEESDKILSKITQGQSYSDNLVNMGKCLKELKRYDEAMKILKKAEAAARASNSKNMLSDALQKQVQVMADQHFYMLDEAKKTAETALQLAREVGSADKIGTAQLLVQKVHLLLAQRDSAHKISGEMTDRFDTMWNQKKAMKLTAMELNFQFQQEKVLDSLNQVKKDTLQKAEIARRNSWLQILGVSLLSLILLGAGGFQFLKNRQKLQATKLENQVVRSELTALRAQLNPHFLFNSLNSIGQFIEKKDPARARDYLAEFARLMRSTLDQSGRTLIPLSEEIETLRRYLSLEALRFRQPFDFEVTAAADLDDFDTQIPPMLVQPFVENAVWHGLSPKNEAGRVQVFFKKENGKLVCTVEDDGVGREAGDKNSDHESAGMNIIRERLDLLARQTGKSADFEIFDLKNSDGQPSGTRVELRLGL